METIALELDHVTKRYDNASGSLLALADISFKLAVGHFLSIMGPSGSGKSTLLNLMAGLDSPSGGRVLIEGKNLVEMSNDARSDLRLRHIGFVFQSFNLFPAFTVEENVAWPLRFLGVRWQAACRKAAAALSQVGIETAARDRRPAELSGGEQQRVAIARALVTEPRLLFADEPTGNLDSRTGQAVLDLLQTLNGEEGLTIVLVTHNTFAATYGHRTIEIQDGTIKRDVRAPREHSARVVPLTS